MTVSHSTEPDIPSIDPRTFPALKVMERQTPPLRHGALPAWRAPVVLAPEDVYIPSWTWSSPLDFPEGESVTVLQVNAHCLLSISATTQIAHSPLVHSGPFAHLPAAGTVSPGYYRITIPYWAFDGTIVSPLGDSARLQVQESVWVAAPTLVLLLELFTDGHLGWLEIIDSWTAHVTSDFHAWAERLRSIRNECLDRIDVAQTELRRRQELARYEAFTEGCESALTMMVSGRQCLTRRPDWAHTVYAQHAADMWRDAWRYTFTTRSLVAMGAVDELAVLSRDVGDVIMRPRPPFRYDATGRQCGALRPKKTVFISCGPPQRGETIDEMEGL